MWCDVMWCDVMWCDVCMYARSMPRYFQCMSRCSNLQHRPPPRAEHVGDGCTVSAVMSSVQKAKQKARKPWDAVDFSRNSVNLELKTTMTWQWFGMNLVWICLDIQCWKTCFLQVFRGLGTTELWGGSRILKCDRSLTSDYYHDSLWYSLV